MAKTDGYSQLVCDRCSKTIYATANSPEAQSWRTIERITADGTTVSRLLCPQCNSEYRELAQSHDAEFSEFMTAIDERSI